MGKIIVLAFILTFYSSILSQDISLGIHGNYLPSVNETGELGTKNYNTFILYGIRTMVRLNKTSPFAAGLKISYGYRTLLNATKDLGYYTQGRDDRIIGTGKRDINIIDIAVPVQYRLFNSKSYSVDVGVSIGARRMNFSNKATMYLNTTGEVIHEGGYVDSKWQPGFTPFVEVGLAQYSPFNILVGLNYEFFEFTYVEISNISELYKIRSETKYKMNGFSISLSALYHL